MTRRLKNLPLRLFRDYLKHKGLNRIRNKGGHEVCSCHHLPRLVILQSHVDLIPGFIVRNNLRTLGVTAKDFYDFVENH